MCESCKAEKSEALVEAINKEIQLPSIACIICNKPFTPKNKKVKTCSPECKETSHNYKRCKNPHCNRLVLKWGLKHDLCYVCTAESEPGVKVDRSSHTITKKCSSCNNNIIIDYEDRKQLKITKCIDCRNKKKPKEERMCPECNQVRLKRRQQICRPCKRKLKQQRQQEKTIKCKTEGCNSVFTRIGNQQYCTDCINTRKIKDRKIKCQTPSCENTFKRVGSQRYCPECKEKRKQAKTVKTRVVYDKKSSSITIKFEDRFYELMNRFMETMRK